MIQYRSIRSLGTLMKKTKKKSNRMISQLQPPQAAITPASSVAGSARHRSLLLSHPF
ncbi:unnamed protein product, partial [Prunus brigantina]